MGDFNDLPNSLTIKTLNKKLDDAMKINLVDHIGPIGTFNGFNVSDPIEKRIDYIFVKDGDTFPSASRFETKKWKSYFGSSSSNN